jgi:hypothetical protein
MQRMVFFGHSLAGQSKQAFELYRRIQQRGQALYVLVGHQLPRLLRSECRPRRLTPRTYKGNTFVNCPSLMPKSTDDIRQSGCKTTPISNTASCDHYDWLPSQRALGALANVDNRWYKNRKRRVARMTTAFSTLRTDDIDA